MKWRQIVPNGARGVKATVAQALPVAVEVFGLGGHHSMALGCTQIELHAMTVPNTCMSAWSRGVSGAGHALHLAPILVSAARPPLVASRSLALNAHKRSYTSASCPVPVACCCLFAVPATHAAHAPTHASLAALPAGARAACVHAAGRRALRAGRGGGGYLTCRYWYLE